MKTLLSILLSLTLLVSCAATDVLKTINPFAEDKGIKATVQLGKENTNVDNKGLINLKDGSTKTTNNDVEAEVFNQTTIEKDAPWLIVFFAVAMGFAVQGIYARKQLRRTQDKLDEIQKQHQEEVDNNGHIREYVAQIKSIVEQNRIKTEGGTDD